MALSHRGTRIKVIHQLLDRRDIAGVPSAYLPRCAIFWLFWQLVGIAVAIFLICLAAAAVFGVGAALVGAVIGFFRLLDAVPGIIAQILDAFANVLIGLFWFVVKAPNKIWLALRGDNRKSATERLLLSKPRTIIYFAKCLLCSERYENSVANEARRLRAEHMQRTHGIYVRETVSDARALPQ